MGGEGGAASDSRRVLYESMRDSSKYIVLGYLIILVGLFIVGGVMLALMGLAIVTGGVFHGFEGVAGLLALMGPLMLFLLIAGGYAVLVAAGYLIYRGARILREGVEAAGGDALELRLGSLLMYYGGLATLLGALTTIILVGFLILVIGGVVWSIGIIIFGLEMRRVLPGFETPGAMLILAGILTLLSFTLIPLTEILGLIGLVIEVLAFMIISGRSSRLLYEQYLGG